MTPAATSSAGSSVSLTDRYFLLLAVALLGYATMGKGFAYIGMPPLFIGEIMFVLGLLMFMRSGCYIAAFVNLPNLILLALLLLAVARTLPFIGPYGFDALRDSVLLLYGGFALIVTALLLEKRERLGDIYRYFQFLASIYVFIAPVAYFVVKSGRDFIPAWPGTGVPIVYLRAGEIAVHVCAAAVIALVGMRKFSVLWTVMLLFTIAMVAAQSRGGALAILIPIAFAILVSGKLMQFAKMGVVGFAVLSAAYALDVQISMPAGYWGGDDRPIGARQLVDNLASIVGESDGQLDDTKQFRLEWWKSIINYTFNGPYFWNGKGFGVNLAIDDDHVVTEDPNAPPLRSPHNGHLNILARTGVPGFTLWVLSIAVWFAMLMKRYITACALGERQWASLFLLLMCYSASIIVDAVFDVALEGPMLGIWYWVIFGIGVGASMIYSAPRPGDGRHIPGMTDESVPVAATAGVPKPSNAIGIRP